MKVVIYLLAIVSGFFSLVVSLTSNDSCFSFFKKIDTTYWLHHTQDIQTVILDKLSLGNMNDKLFIAIKNIQSDLKQDTDEDKEDDGSKNLWIWNLYNTHSKKDIYAKDFIWYHYVKNLNIAWLNFTDLVGIIKIII